MSENFTAKYMGLLQKKTGLKILDGFGNEVSTLMAEDDDDPEFIYNIGWRKPRLIVDLFQKAESESKIIVWRHQQGGVNYLENLKRLGLEIVSIPVSIGERWFPHQRVRYKLLKREEAPFVNNATKISLIPKSCYVQYDSANKKIRLCGNVVSKNFYGDWIYLNQ